jgi:membrane-bound lytic murein transglycosylase D
MQNADAHNITSTKPIAQYLETDTVVVKGPVTFQAIAQHTNTPIDLLRFLNPIYRRGIVPENENGNYIRLPISKVPKYIEKEKDILNTIPSHLNFHDILAKAGSTENRVEITHSVQPGDYLHKIAVKYNCTIDDINIWNPNMNSDLAIGQQVKLWVDKQTYDMIKQPNIGL